MSSLKKNFFSVLLITILATIIYSNSFDVPFHFDDKDAIVENYDIHQFNLKKIFTKSTRPILDITFALNYYFGKLDVFGYHLVNIILHIANGVMLYFILLWTINDFKVPLYASLIFIVHPIQTQAVTYIVSRSSVLAIFFYLLSLLLFIQAFRSSNSLLYLSGAFLSSCFGMGTKQIVVTLPLMLLIYDFYFISDGKLRVLKNHYKIHSIMFSTTAIAVYLSFSGLKKFISFDYTEGIPMKVGEPAITSFQYFLTQLNVIPYYIKLLFLPTNLNLDYDWPITNNIDMKTLLFFILLAGIVITAIKLFKRSRLISFGIIWFFVTLSVTSSFLVIRDVIFEHHLYLPSAGFAIFMAVVISKISNLKQKFKDW